MNEIEGFEQVESVPTGPRRPRGPWIWPIVAALMLVLLLIIYLIWLRKPPPPPPPQPAAAEEPQQPTAPPEAAAEPELALPSLDASDAVVRELVATLSAHPKLVAWLIEDELIRRFTVTVVNIAEGVSPRKHLPFLEPREEYRSRSRAGRLYVDPRSYARYDLAAEVFASIDARGAADLYRKFEPLIQEAYRDLGYPEGDFNRVLRQAISRLLRAPRLTGDIELEQKVRTFAYADPRYESLGAAEKQFLRMGAKNVASVQAKLTEIALALGMRPEELR